MKPTQRPQPAAPQDEHHTRLYFNIFMGLLGLGLVYMIVLLFMI